MDLDAVFADKKKRAEPDVDLAPIPQYDFLKNVFVEFIGCANLSFPMPQTPLAQMQKEWFGFARPKRAMRRRGIMVRAWKRQCPSTGKNCLRIKTILYEA